MNVSEYLAIKEKILKGELIRKEEVMSMLEVTEAKISSKSAKSDSKDELKDRLEKEKARLKEIEIAKAKEKEEEEFRKKLTVSKFQLDKNKYITVGGYFQVSNAIYSILKRNIQKGVNTMLLGPTGIGKTELLWNIGKELGLETTIFDMGTMSDPIMSLIGTHTMKVKDGHTYSEFVASRFSEVIQKPGLVILDEVSRIPPAGNNLLFPCLDFRKELPMEYSFGNNKPIKVHPECVFVSTANIGSQYTGTFKIDRALMDRFVPIEVPELDFANTLVAIKNFAPSLDEKVLNFIVRVYFEVNKQNKEFSCSIHFSFRHLKIVTKMVEDGFTVFDSFVILAKGLNSEIGGNEVTEIISTLK